MIQQILIREYDEQYAPPENVLNVAVVGKRVFLSIDTYKETGDSVKTKQVADITVDGETLLNAILLLHHADVRQDNRDEQ